MFHMQERQLSLSSLFKNNNNNNNNKKNKKKQKTVSNAVRRFFFFLFFFFIFSFKTYRRCCNRFISRYASDAVIV